MGRGSICSFNCISSTLRMQCGFFWASSWWCHTVNVLSLLGALSPCTLILPGSPHWPPPPQTLSQSIFMEVSWHCTAVKGYSVFSTLQPELQQSSQVTVPWWYGFYFVSFYQFYLNCLVFISFLLLDKFFGRFSLMDCWDLHCSFPTFTIIFHTFYIVTELLS